MRAKIQVERDALTAFCRKHHIAKLSFFGSVLRDDFAPQSDVDVLVEFEADHVPGLLAFCGMEEELSKILDGRRIDLLTPASLSPRLKPRVLSSAEVQYAEG